MSAAKIPINIVVIGYADPSNSTATTNSLITMAQGNHTSFEMQETETGKGNFKYAWVLEMMEAQRERGITIDIAIGYFETTNYNVNVVNVPGLADFAKSINTGISQADAAILVIGSGTGQIEESETLKQLQLAFANCLQLIVGIENMESTEPAYSEAQLEIVKSGVSSTIRDIGYNPAEVAFVPFSSSQKDNVTEPSTQMPWFRGWSVERAEGGARGTCLLEAIDALLPPASTTCLS